MAKGLNAATKYVATHRPDSLGWGPVQALGADIVAAEGQLFSPESLDAAYTDTDSSLILQGF